MKKTCLCIFTALLSCFVYSQSYNFKGFELNESLENYNFKFSLPQLDSIIINANDEDFISYSLKDYGHTSDVGYPQLPKICFNIIIPNDVDKCKAKITGKKTKDKKTSHRIYPVQQPWDKSDPISKRPFKINDSYYKSNGGKYKELVEISEPFILRGIKGVTISIYPISYSPSGKKIELIEELTFNVSFKSDDKKETLNNTTYSDYLNQVFVNYESSTLKSGTIDDFLIIASDDFDGNSDLSSFVNHKKSLGYNVDVFYTDETGETNSSIKDFIQDRYDNSVTRPEYVLLIGDTDEIPHWTGDGWRTPETDLNYSLLDGSDYVADVFIGRWPVRTASALQNIVDKTIYMENSVSTLDRNNVFMASSDNYTVSEGTHNSVINNYFLEEGYTNLKLYCYTYSATTPQVTNAFNSNKIFGIYSGHGSEYSWADGPYFSQSNVNALTNSIFPFVYSFACQTGSYEQSECFAETWIRTDNGAVTFYGSSVNSQWTPDDILEKELIEAKFDNSLHQVCPMFNQARTGLINAHFGGYGSVTSGSSGLTYLEQYNLFGDPSISTSTYCPSNITLQNIQIENNQSNSYQADNNITVAGSGTTFKAKSGSDVTLYAGNEITLNSGFEIELGATLTLDNKPCETSGTTKSAAIKNSESENEVSDLLLVDDIVNISIKVIPNPNPGSFKVVSSNTEGVKNIEIYDLSGKVIYGSPTTQNETEINISDQPNGLYLLKLFINDQVFTEKIIKD